MKRNHIDKFKYAINGWKIASKGSSFKIQLVITILTFLLSFVFKINQGEWLAIIFCCFLVLCAELFNTALEVACDIFSRGWLLDEIRIIKDLAAGAVLIISIGSAIIGAIIFIPKIIDHSF